MEINKEEVDKNNTGLNLVEQENFHYMDKETNNKELSIAVTTVTTVTSADNENLSSVSKQTFSEEAIVSSTNSLDTGDNFNIMEEVDKNKKDIEETQSSEVVDRLIGYREPFHYCKQHPHVQNINREEIERHILYSKDHQAP